MVIKISITSFQTKNVFQTSSHILQRIAPDYASLELHKNFTEIDIYNYETGYQQLKQIPYQKCFYPGGVLSTEAGFFKMTSLALPSRENNTSSSSSSEHMFTTKNISLDAEIRWEDEHK